MTDEAEQKPEATKFQPPSDVSRREGQFIDQAKQGDWTLATEGNRATQKDSATMESLSDQRIAEIKAKGGFQKFELFDPLNPGNGSASDTGTVIDYQPTLTDKKTYALGMDYEEGRDTRSVYEKLSDFGTAASKRAADTEGQTAYIQGQLDKMIGVGEGLNIAKDSTKAAAFAGWTALTDGTVADFLAKPNAINDPLFHAVGGTLDAMAQDPSAVNHALERVGTIILNSSERYSAAPNREKGHVIGETMFAMVNPEGSTEGGQAALRVADNVATHIDQVVMDGIQKSLQVTEDMAQTAPEMAQQAKRMLYDYTKQLGMTPQEMELAGIPKGYFDGMQPSAIAKDNYFAMSKDEGFENGVRKTDTLREIERIPVGEGFLKHFAEAKEKITQAEKNFLEATNIEIRPINSLSGKYEGLGACYSPEDNAIYIPEKIKSFGQWIDNDDVPHRIRHEIGHLFNARANPLRGSLSDEAGFIEVYKRDLEKLTPKQLDELQLSGRSKSNARDEVFADMYGHASGKRSGTECAGSYSLMLKAAFPNCLKYLEEI